MLKLNQWRNFVKMNKNQKKEILNAFGGAAGAFFIGWGIGVCYTPVTILGMIIFIPSLIKLSQIIERRRWTE